jgi:glucosamine kinase
MALFLGIDGGGTGCRAAVCDGAGQVLGEGRAGPSNIASDPDGARANVLAAATKALPDGATLGQLSSVMGLAGANVAQSVARFSAGLPFARLRVESDALIAVKGALHDRDGLVAAIGTGSVFASQRAGSVVQIGGWGLVLGDEASGAWIGRSILSRSLRAADGMEAMTPLLSGLLADYGGADGIIAFAQSARPGDMAALAPRVVDADDPAAQAVMDAADAHVRACVTRLRGDSDLPVVFLGGLGPVFAARLQGLWTIRQASGTALDGALWLARQAG